MNLLTAEKQQFERAARNGAKAVYVGGNVNLCRVLGKYKMYVDTRDESIAPCLMMDGIWESWITVHLKQLVKPGMHVANIGANVGYYVMCLADLVGKEGRVYAYEPQKELAHLLERSARANGFYQGHVIVMAMAVGDVSDEVQLCANEWRNGYAYVQDGKAQAHLVHGGSENRRVSQTKLDDLFLSLREPRLDFVLMDVEGSEERVWDGMQAVLGKNPKLQMVLEFTPMFLEDPMRFAKKLTAFGHKIVEIDEQAGLREIGADELCKRYQTNIVLLK